LESMSAFSSLCQAQAASVSALAFALSGSALAAVVRRWNSAIATTFRLNRCASSVEMPSGMGISHAADTSDVVSLGPRLRAPLFLFFRASMAASERLPRDGSVHTATRNAKVWPALFF